MGLTGFFRKSIPEFAAWTACVNYLTKEDVPFVWKSKHVEAKNYIVNCLTSQPLLIVFNPDLPTELHTDARSIGYGAILLQKYDGQNRVVAYFSRRITSHESKYHSYKFETLVIVKALKLTRLFDRY